MGTDDLNNAVSGDGKPARDWVRTLANYRDPSYGRSFLEIAVTAIPFFAIWAAAWWALGVSYWLAVALAAVNGLFLVRLFIIQHDCGHGAYFKNRQLNDWVGRAIGILTLTPYDVWKRSHNLHHNGSGNLDKRSLGGEVATLTVVEYRSLPRWQRFKYRMYRHPLVLFGLGPSYIYFLTNRLPYGMMHSAKYWLSAMGTNLGIAVALGLIVWFGGWQPLALIFVPTTLVGATAGIWMFYVQHQFEDAQWDEADNWDMHEAALHGSSHYVLPQPLQWLTGNIGIHHVHHLYSRIPFYRLTEVLHEHPALEKMNRLSVRESFACVKLQLWDEKERKLLSYAQMKAAYGPV